MNFCPGTIVRMFRGRLGVMARWKRFQLSLVACAGVMPLLAACSDALPGENQGGGASGKYRTNGSNGTFSAAGTTSSRVVEVDSITPCLKGFVPSVLPVTLRISSDSIPLSAQDFVLPTWLSLLAYKDSKTVLKNLRRAGFGDSEVASFDFFRPVQGSFSSSQGFVAQSARGRFVVFRGSDSPMDWVSNFKSSLVERPALFGAKAAVHQGFMELAESSFDEIFRALKSADGDSSKLPVWVVGHSLGGAQAAIFALVAARRGVNIGAVVTLSQPRVGNKEFAQLLASTLGSRYVRLLRPEDVVPHVPPTAAAASVASRFLSGAPVPYSEEDLSRFFVSAKYGHAGAQFDLFSNGRVAANPSGADGSDIEFFQDLLVDSGAKEGGSDSHPVGFFKSKTLVARGLDHLPEGAMCALLQGLR